jgi:oxaloacetate decarboxylase alpha subunit
MMLPVAEMMDAAGFEAIELATPIEMVKCVRELREDPWERYRSMARRIRKTPLRAIHGTRAGFEIYPKEIHQLWDECVARSGIRQVRISDCWNDYAEWRWRVDQARRAGLEPIVNLIYSISPRHTDDYYAERTRAAAELDAARLCLKDPGGLLTPERVRSLAPLILRNAGTMPVELHTHCNTGLGPLCCLEAIRLGMVSINTAVPPLADDSSNPSVYNVARNARALGFFAAVDEEPLKGVTEHLLRVARREGLAVGGPVEYDCSQYVHQIPGGMISNLRHQLQRVGMEDRLPETLEEAARVRSDLGYPIMVTPLSQFVGSQAAINVIAGERYKEVTDQMIQYALGIWGEEGSRSMDSDLRDRILARPRAREVASAFESRPTMSDLRARLGGSNVSNFDLLLRFLAGAEEIARMRAVHPARDGLDARSPLVILIEGLTKQPGAARVDVTRPGFSIHLEKTTGR